MAIRNFYLKGRIDWRNTNLSGGPVSKNGGMCVDLFIRNLNTSQLAIRINCVEVNGKLILNVEDGNGKTIHRIETKR